MARAVKKPATKRPATRRYDSSRRQAQARETQGHIAERARELFVERGYAETSIRDIADHAGVAVQTIYNAFDGKPAILARIADMAVVGDDEPVALDGRAETAAVLAADDPAEVIERWATMCTGIFLRFLPLLPVLREAAAREPTIREQWRRNGVDHRYQGTRAVAERLAAVGGLRAGLTVDQAADQLFTIASFETAESLIVERGWTTEAFTAWLATTIRRLVLPD